MEVPRIPFSFQGESADFERELAREISSRVEALREEYFPAENVSTFKHGIRWQLHGETPNEASTLTEHATNAAIKHRDVVECNTSALETMIAATSTEMHASFMRSLYGAVSATTEQTGNVVSAAGGVGTAQAFLQMLQKIEFGVGSDGEPRLPQIHAHPDAVNKLIADLIAQPPEFAAEVETLKRIKSAKAKEREAQRIARFARPDE